MKIVNVEFHMSSDDDGNTEMVGRGFMCETSGGVTRYRALFDALVEKMGEEDMLIYRDEHGEPKLTERDHYRRLAERLAVLHGRRLAEDPETEALLDEFLGDTWRTR